MKFSYQARSKEGKIETGTVEASSRDAAASVLQKYDVTVVSIKEIKSPLSLFRGISFLKKANKKDLAIFSRQLAVMLDARVPIVQSLLSLGAQTGKARLKEVLINISGLVEEGNTLSEAFAQYPEVFDAFYINLIKSGEASGKISEALYYMGDHLEREYDINSKIKGAMVYPVLVLSVLFIVIVIVMTVVMPKLMDMIKEAGGELPMTTKVLIVLYQFFLHFGWIILIAFVALIIFLIYYFRTKEGKKIYDRVILRVPFVGPFLEKVFLIRFAENLSTLITAGLPITSALRITKNTIGNFVYRRIAAETEKAVSEGEKISSVLVRYPERVPSFVIQMVKVGEETGRMDKTLMEIVNFYQKEVTRLVDTFMTLVEPILIVILGVAVAILAISVLSPLYGMLGAM